MLVLGKVKHMIGVLWFGSTSTLLALVKAEGSFINGLSLILNREITYDTAREFVDINQFPTDCLFLPGELMHRRLTFDAYSKFLDNSPIDSEIKREISSILAPSFVSILVAA